MGSNTEGLSPRPSSLSDEDDDDIAGGNNLDINGSLPGNYQVGSTSQQEPDDQLVADQPQPSVSRANNSMHVSVHRAEISATTVQEGNDELRDLDVEVYDQQTYERGVFEQVDKAISRPVGPVQPTRDASQIGEQPNPANINDLMRLIHDQDGQEQEETVTCDINERDEQVLQLARQQRLNRPIKVEPREPQEQNNDRLSNLPRIPRLSKSTPSVQPEIKPSISNIRKGATSSLLDYPPQSLAAKRKRGSPLFARQTQSDDEFSQSGESSANEYRPAHESSDDDEDNFDEDVEFESDDEPAVCDDDQDTGSRRKRKTLEDDGDFKYYQARIKAYTKERAKMRLDNILEDGTEFKRLDEMVTLDGDLKIPKDMWDNLFEHQRTGVRWMWELHQLGAGGVLGDEMGLGKTIQMIAFLTALRSSNLANAHRGYENLGPVVLVCPATVMHQWLLEFRRWWPPFRVAILHNTGTFSGDRKHLVQTINKFRGVLIVSYPGVVIYQDHLHALDWHYAILDEGHKIRNPDAQVTLACKRFRTPHRIILSGSPVQNNLKELWSIFDFIYPGKLGTLPVFMEQFATPITQGGYANASDFQVQIAYKCACVLRDTIKPFLLRRTKAEVNNKLKLPERSEQVLFCKLTEKQRRLYQAYLDSPTVRDIKRGMCQIFVGLIQLRKICNHPNLFDAGECRQQLKKTQQVQNKKHLEFFSVDETFGHFQKSGKMMVVDALLKLWKQQNHKVLLFTQSRQMLKIFTNFMGERQYRYLLMDGATPIGVRQTMIEEFNKNDEIFIFLLTTRVGGVGVNLTGANRIIIYDPDWNPSTDIQARERAWRIGQQRHVIIYRLLTAGTIEEKIYHRQVFKLYLTNRILKDAKQKRFFKTNDMHELFRLGDDEKNIETKALFDDDLQIDANTIKAEKKRRKDKKTRRNERKRLRQLAENNLTNSNEQTEDGEVRQVLSEEKLLAMRERAKRLSQMIALQYGSQPGADQQGSSQVRIKIEPGLELAHQTARQEGADSVVRVKAEPDVEFLEPDAVDTESGAVLYKPPAPEPSSSRRRSFTGKRSAPTKQHVEYLVKQDIYRPDREAGDGAESDPRYRRDDYILERLFKSSNIFGALKHDKIETDSTSDFKVVESEAEKVARDAIRALRESRRMCLDSRMGVPNWTGRNGQVANKPRLVPKNKSRAQLMGRPTPSTSSSAGKDSLLSSIRKRNQTNPIALAQSAFGVHQPDSDEEEQRDRDFSGRAQGTGAQEMADQVRQFVLFGAARNGEAQTDELLEFFKNKFTADKTAVFKAILYKMCVFHRRGEKGFWVLKSEMRE